VRFSTLVFKMVVRGSVSILSRREKQGVESVIGNVACMSNGRQQGEIQLLRDLRGRNFRLRKVR